MLIKASQLRVAPRALMFDPEFYLFDFSLRHGITKFLLVDENNLRLAPFVDIRFEPLARGSFLMATLELLALERQHQMQRPPSSFIFHHAFVCSTLLARCLDRIDAFFSLKEPWIMRRLADTKRQHGAGMPRSQWRQLFTTYMLVLCKQYESGKSPVIKATNVANNLLPDVLRYLPGNRALYLFSDLRSFLVSNLKKPQETQQKMPSLARGFIHDDGFAAAHRQYCDIDRLSFLQVCAVTWVACLFNFRKTVEKSRGSQVRTLDANDFLERPQERLGALATFFGHPTTGEEIAAMTSPEVMDTHAKQQKQCYGRDARAREAKLTLSRHAQAIDATLHWVEPLVRQLGVVEYMHSLRLD